MKYIVIASGGAFGALLRYALSGFIYRFSSSGFPAGTLGVNLLGAFVIGLLWSFFEEFTLPPNLRSFVFIGVIASFTTFSTYCLETLNLARDGEWKYAIMNFLLSNVLGIGFVFLGFLAFRWILQLVRG
ncbi:MAG: fluoride efflux transporter CrcB [Candidatus Hydrogenedentota bacterium]|nr:MAG: fluoride efflux transporter CrcB [Candidatus Hydrogenedentota bacterium]